MSLRLTYFAPYCFHVLTHPRPSDITSARSDTGAVDAAAELCRRDLRLARGGVSASSRSGVSPYASREGKRHSLWTVHRGHKTDRCGPPGPLPSTHPRRRSCPDQMHCSTCVRCCCTQRARRHARLIPKPWGAGGFQVLNYIQRSLAGAGTAVRGGYKCYVGVSQEVLRGSRDREDEGERRGGGGGVE